MQIRSLKLVNFKRFTELEIITEADHSSAIPMLVVLIGPNGTGKSSIFDSFEQIGGRQKPGHSEDQTYLRKDSSKDWTVNIKTDKGEFSKSKTPSRQHFYIRSSYRFDPDLQVGSIQKKDDILGDTIRPKRMIDLDRRVQDNYERLVGSTVSNVYSGENDEIKVKQLREEIVGEIRERMQRVFGDLVLEGVGNPLTEGQFFFTKGCAKHFPYKNLSSGEKGAFDVLLDLTIKIKEFNDTVIAIDEPELHMHSSLQRALLKEIFDLISDNCQLWVATHSIGFIRGSLELSRLNPGQVALLDLADRDFDAPQKIVPLASTPGIIRKIFSVAIDDLAQMIIPSTLVFCEGSLQSGTTEAKRGFDAKIYNSIFSHEDVLFVPANSKRTAQESAELILTAIEKSGAVREVLSLVDRDSLTDSDIKGHQQKKPHQKFTGRKAIENYLLDNEIIDKYCALAGIEAQSVTSRLSDPFSSDGKEIQSAVMQQCRFNGAVEDFLLRLATLVTPDTKPYRELKSEIGI